MPVLQDDVMYHISLAGNMNSYFCTQYVTLTRSKFAIKLGILEAFTWESEQSFYFSETMKGFTVVLLDEKSYTR